jgi:acyl-CoA thioesterase-1
MGTGWKWSLVALAAAAAAASCGGRTGREPDGTRGAAPDSAARDRAAPSAPRADKRTIVFLGTSLTAGFGLDPDSSFTSIIQRRIDSLGLSYDVVNAGVSGETSAGAVRRIGWVMRQPAAIVVLEVGANDGLRALDVDSLRSNLQHIIDTVRATHPQARIVIVGMEAPPNLGARYTSAFRAVYPEIAKKNDAVLLPFLLSGVGGVDSLNQGDGIHPNSHGERIVADTVWRTLAPLLGVKAEAKSAA